MGRGLGFLGLFLGRGRCHRVLGSRGARPLVVELGELGGEGAASPSRRPGSQASRWRGPPESTPGGCSASENLGQPTGGSGSTASVHTLRGTAAARNLDPPPDARAGLRGWVIHPALYIERRCGSARGTSAPEARRRRGRADAPSSTGLKRGSCAPWAFRCRSARTQLLFTGRPAPATRRRRLTPTTRPRAVEFRPVGESKTEQPNAQNRHFVAGRSEAGGFERAGGTRSLEEPKAGAPRESVCRSGMGLDC